MRTDACRIAAGAILGSALVLATDWFGFRAALGTTNRLSDWVSVSLGTCARVRALEKQWTCKAACAGGQFATAHALHSAETQIPTHTKTHTQTQATVGSALGVEILLTAIFVFIVMAATDQTRGASTPHLPALAPLAIGVAVSAALLRRRLLGGLLGVVRLLAARER
jgi:glycerol uptake facilitator-like aquaporin